MFIWTSRILALVAIGTSGLLSWMSFQGATLPGCNFNSAMSCDHVLQSPWSRWLGMPVSVWGLGVYAAIFGLSWLIGRPEDRRRHFIAWRLMVPLLVVAAGAGIWFLIVQGLFLKTFCPYCVATHACGIVVALLLLPRVPQSSPTVDYTWLRQMSSVSVQQTGIVAATGPSANRSDGLSRRHIATLLVMATFALVTLVGGQLIFKPKTYTVRKIVANEVANEPMIDERPITGTDATTQNDQTEDGTLATDDTVATELTESSVTDNNPTTIDKYSILLRERFVTLLMGQRAFNIYEQPILGDPKAPHIVVDLVSYSCKACRQMHRLLVAAKERYGDQLAIVVRPIGLSPNCNEFIYQKRPEHQYSCQYAKLALSVWLADPSKFSEIHRWLLEREDAPPLDEARDFAAQLVGDDALERGQRSLRIKNAMKSNHLLWHRSGKKLPTLYFSTQVLSGIPTKKELFGELETHFNLQTPDG